MARERKQLLQEEKERVDSFKETIGKVSEPKIAKTSKYNISPVPPLLDGLYPNDAVATLPEKGSGFGLTV